MSMFHRKYSTQIISLIEKTFISYYQKNEFEYKQFFIDYKNIFEIILNNNKQLSFAQLNKKINSLLKEKHIKILNLHLLENDSYRIYQEEKLTLNISKHIKIFQKLLKYLIPEDNKLCEQIYITLKKELSEKKHLFANAKDLLKINILKNNPDHFFPNHLIENTTLLLEKFQNVEYITEFYKHIGFSHKLVVKILDELKYERIDLKLDEDIIEPINTTVVETIVSKNRNKIIKYYSAQIKTHSQSAIINILLESGWSKKFVLSSLKLD